MRPDSFRGFGPVGTNGPAESHDDVVAEMRDSDPMIPPFSTVTEWADRLQSAHARELAERSAAFDAARELMARDLRKANDSTEEYERRYYLESDRVDAAMGLLREVADEQIEPPQTGSLIERIDAFLAQQALASGERKDG